MSKKHKKFKKWLRKYDWDWPVMHPKLYIEPKAYEKLSYFVQLADGEISGFGKIKYIKPPIKTVWDTTEKIMVEDVEIFEQGCSAGGTTLDGDALSKFIVSLIKRKQNPHDWRLWWHSHNDFGVSWSGVDEMAISGLIEPSDAELISICINKDSDVIARRDKNKGRKYERLDVRILPRINVPIFAKCEREFKKKVSKWVLPKYSDLDIDWGKSKEWPLFKKDTLLLEHKPRYVKLVTDRQSLVLGLRYNPDTGLFTRISDNKIINGEELRRELRETEGHRKPIIDIKISR